jgi:hypothetical protein
VKGEEDRRAKKIAYFRDLNGMQENTMKVMPSLILRYAHHLRDQYTAQGLSKPVVTVEALLRINHQSKSYHLIDPNVDLSKVSKSFLKHSPWIMQYNDQ